MSTYFISDIHGEYDLFMRLLDKVHFDTTDLLYVGGDMVDKGEQSVAVVRFVRTTPNVQSIAGNHDFAFVRDYHNIMKTFAEGDDPDNVLSQLARQFGDGADLCWEDVDFLEGLPLWIQTPDFTLVHAGVKVDGNGHIGSLAEQHPYDLLGSRDFAKPSIVLAPDEPTVLFGHTPTCYFNDTGDFIMTPRQGIAHPSRLADYAKICLDCGVWLNGKLGILCADDMQQTYITK